MNKKELINLISQTSQENKQLSKKMLDIVLQSITDTLSQGEEVSITGFGSFKVREKEAYVARNPQTGKPIDVPKSKTPVFKAGLNLKQAVNHE